MIATLLLRLGAGERLVAFLASPVLWAVVGWTLYSAWLIGWAGDRREAEVRASYAAAVRIKNAEIERTNAAGQADRAAAAAERRLATEEALSPPMAGAECGLPPEIIAKLNRIK